MKKIISVLILTICFSALYAQKNPAYLLYNAKGKKVSYKKMMKKLAAADIILFGEFHNNPISHWLQLEVTQDLHQTRQLMLGAEMIERDNQEVLNQYLNGEITAEQLDSLARLWNNYNTDYAPLVNFAKAQNLKFVASNVPRRYASQLYHQGLASLDALPAQDKQWIAPLPFAYDPTLPGYKAMFELAGGGEGAENFPLAQAIKDATMAHSILENYEAGKLFIHYNGAYHSDNFEGIYWYLKQQNPDLKIVTISTVEQDKIKPISADNQGKADITICVPANMTKTY